MILNDEISEQRCISSRVDSRKAGAEGSHFAETINYHWNSIETIGFGEAYDGVYRDRFLSFLRGRKGFEESLWSMADRFDRSGPKLGLC